MKKAGWLLLLALAGCAQVGGPSSAMSGGPADTEARSRAKLYTELGFAYFNRGQMKVALEEARKAIASDDRFGPGYNLLALIYMELDEDKLAEENFRKSLDVDRAYPEAHNNYGWYLCTRGRYDEGLAQFSEALRDPLYDKPEQAMSNAGLCSEKKGDLKQAEGYYTKALKLQPDAPQPLLKLAGLHFRNGNLSEAQRLLARYQEISQPTAESLWLNLRIQRKLGDKAQVGYYYEQLRKRFPDAPETKLLMQGQYE